jgi:toxin FitB
VSWIIDTNVLSEPSKPRADRRVMAWLDSQDSRHFFLSALTLGEIQKGAIKLPASARRDRILHWLHHDVRQRFANRILVIDSMVALRWGTLVAETRRTLPLADSLLAATALTHDFTLVTRNTTDFQGTGVRLFNPWEYEP